MLLLRPRERVADRADWSREPTSARAELERAARFRAGQLRLCWRRRRSSSACSLVARGRRRAARQARRPVRAGAAAAARRSPLALDGGRAAARARSRASAPSNVGLVTQSWGGWAVDVAKGAGDRRRVSAGGRRRVAGRWHAPLRARAGGRRAPARGRRFGVASAYARAGRAGPDLQQVHAAAARRHARRRARARPSAPGVDVGEVYEVDASRRTTAANAYVTGLGPTKRVVLFDTLLRDFTPRRDAARRRPRARPRALPRRRARLACSRLVAPSALLAIARLGERIAPAGHAHGPAALPGLALARARSAPVARRSAPTSSRARSSAARTPSRSS